MKQKTKLILECKCRICRTMFAIYDWLPRDKAVGGGVNISSFVCPNCQQPKLDFDILVVKDGF